MAIGELAEFIDATDLIAAVTGFKGTVGGPGTGLGPSQKDMENAVTLLAETLSKVVQVSGVYIDEMKKGRRENKRIKKKFEKNPIHRVPIQKKKKVKLITTEVMQYSIQ